MKKYITRLEKKESEINVKPIKLVLYFFLFGFIAMGLIGFLIYNFLYRLNL